MTQHTLSIGPLSLLASQSGPLLTITIHAPSDSAPVGRMTLTVAEWIALVTLVDRMEAAEKRHAEDKAEIERLTALTMNPGATLHGSTITEIAKERDEYHEMLRAILAACDDSTRASIGKDAPLRAVRKVIADRDSLRQQVRDLTAEHVRDALMVAALRARLAKAETQVQPDIFQLGNESDALRTEIAAIKIDRDEWRVQHDAAVECWREEVGRITAERDSLRQQLAAAQVELARIKEQDLPAELRERRALELHVDDESRCAVCGWPLAESVAKGCVRGNCSQRPRPENLYAPERAAKEQHKE